MLRVLLGMIAAAGIYWGWQYLPTSEEMAASRAQAAAEKERSRLNAKAAYVAENLPLGCTIDHLPKYGPVENIVMVRCAAYDVVAATSHWQESRTYNCGMSLCTAYDDKFSSTVTVAPAATPEQGH